MYGKYGEERFPQLIIDEEALRQNVRYFADLCGAKGIDLAGVVKGASGLPATIRAFADGGAAQIASSRLEQLENVKKLGIDKPTMLLRVPMLSEIEDVIRIADISKSYNCPLAYMLRKRLRKEGISKGVTVVFSEELPDRDAIIEAEDRNKKSQAGTLSYLPASFGCACAQAALDNLITLRQP